MRPQRLGQISSLLISYIFHHGYSFTSTFQASALNPLSKESGDKNYYRASTSSVHLISLPPLYIPSSGVPGDVGSGLKISSKCVRDLWRWKDKCLGDGRDYFIPRPRAIGAINNLILQNNNHSDELYELLSNWPYKIDEVAVLSNCARLDVILICSSNICDDVELCNEELDRFVRTSVASCLLSQLENYSESIKNTFFDTVGINSMLDVTGMVNECPRPCRDVSLIDKLSRELKYVEGIANVTRHLCEVTIGIAARPSRPGREVLFRPFSSRDSHIMLQMKRTKKLSVGGSRIGMLFDASLQAGKRARNPNILPEVKDLKPYGNTPNYPADLSNRAAIAVREKVMEPIVAETVSKFSAMKASLKIKKLRASIELAISKYTLQQHEDDTIKKIMHEATMRLRKGDSVDEDLLLDEIRGMLEVSNLN